MKKNIDKDPPGLRKLIDTLSYYYEVIKYKKTFNEPETSFSDISLLIYDTETSDDDDDHDDDYLTKDELKKFLYHIHKKDNDSDSDIDINYDSDSDSDSDE